MKKQLLILLLPLLWVVCAKSQTSSLHIIPSQWREDIHYFGEQLVKKHKNAFHHVSKEEFEHDIEQLYNDALLLKDYEVIVRLMQITAKVGDGHTAVHLPTSFKRYPFAVNWFENTLYVNSAAPAYRDVLGTRLTKINNLPIEEVTKRLATILSQDENKWFDMATGAALLPIPEILVSLKIVPEYDHAKFYFLDSNNKEIVKDISPVATSQVNMWISVSKTQPLFRQKQNDPFWFEYLPDINGVFLSFKKYDELASNADKLFAFIDEKKAERLIVDLRFNGGGDFKKGRRLLINRIKENKLINQKGHLFVITGRRTFSAAMVNAIDFKNETNAIILGEPPGERPNSYSENDEMKLPNSGLIISYSTRYYKFLEKDADAFEPDIRIDPKWKDHFEGRDAVLEWILDYCKKL